MVESLAPKSTHATKQVAKKGVTKLPTKKARKFGHGSSSYVAPTSPSLTPVKGKITRSKTKVVNFLKIGIRSQMRTLKKKNAKSKKLKVKPHAKWAK